MTPAVFYQKESPLGHTKKLQTLSITFAIANFKKIAFHRSSKYIALGGDSLENFGFDGKSSVEFDMDQNGLISGVV